MEPKKEVNRTISSIQPVNKELMEKAMNYINTLTKPLGSLGRIEELAIQLAGMKETIYPEVSPPGIAVFAADHGITSMGISAYPKDVTVQMVYNFLNGGAAINAFAKEVKGNLKIVDIGIATQIEHNSLLQKNIKKGTNNFADEPAMTYSEVYESILVGIQTAETLIDEGANSIIVGEMGIGNTTSASALVTCITGCSVNDAVGYGTGITEEIRRKKEDVITKALMLHQPNAKDAIDLLSKIGGLEIAAMTGAILKAAEQRIPVILDGFICTSAALLASLLEENVTDYLIAGHLSQEQGHKHALSFLGKKALLELDLRLGEGSGAALAYPLVSAACSMVKNMATFETAKVSEKM
ncbi:nicotinate-nucleotide--dimethylbenzimidazole phosphoribosyltransferase [Metabacillus sp. HB246100]